MFPSKAEGFGLPVIEAMMRGRPVFMSDRTSLPEIGGPLGFYWHSFDPDSMAGVFREGMQLVNDDDDFERKLKGYAEQFSWQRAAAKYMTLYHEFLSDHIGSCGQVDPLQRRCA